MTSETDMAHSPNLSAADRQGVREVCDAGPGVAIQERAFRLGGLLKEGVMHKVSLVAALIAAVVCTAALASDMLPLKQGIYVPGNRPCKGASNAEIVNYWGGKSSLGSAQATCTIDKMTRNGKVFTIADKCVDIRGGGEISGGPTVVTISSPTSFSLAGESYRYCGTKVQF